MPKTPENSSNRKVNPLRGELQVILVPLPPDRRLAWHFGMVEFYEVLEEYLVRERAAGKQEAE